MPPYSCEEGGIEIPRENPDGESFYWRCTCRWIDKKIHTEILYASAHIHTHSPSLAHLPTPTPSKTHTYTQRHTHPQTDNAAFKNHFLSDDSPPNCADEQVNNKWCRNVSRGFWISRHLPPVTGIKVRSRRGSFKNPGRTVHDCSNKPYVETKLRPGLDWQPCGLAQPGRVARFGLFEAKKTNLAFLKIGWPRNFWEFIKWLTFFLVHRSLYSIKSKFFLS